LRFVPKKVDDSVNVSKEHPLVEASTLVVGLALIFIVIAAALILMVDLVLMFVSPEREAQLFSDWMPDGLVAVNEEDERVVELQALVARLARHWEDAPYEFRVEIMDDEDLNALALPGGRIVVTSGLLDEVESENELAFVLGHEMGHFKNRDHIRALGRGVVLSIFFIAISGNEGGANLGMTIGDLTLRSFSRGQESDADEFGLEIVYKEYGHVAEAWRFFERIDERGSRLLGFGTYLSTHPSADDRVETLIEIAEDKGWPVTGPVVYP
jgi:Zn-dependent protease with chaperone function